ncbi:tRNA methyltransferase 1 [Carabus blaptoides fortunei]
MSETQGQATVKTEGNVFYNPVQEFNRDLSISVCSVFAVEFIAGSLKNNGKQNDNEEEDDDNIKISVIGASKKETGVVYEDGITILEALSATGLRSIRYAKEIPGVKKIIANDISKRAVESIMDNIKSNSIDNIVETSHSDAVMLMYAHRQQKIFDVIDLDPYGCPSIFLDSAVQAIKDGGLLLVTATDMAVLAGNCPETCYSKYGAISLRMKACHEMALRILLQCIESHANRYGRYIEPLLSISADFYIRVFVRIFSGAAKCKYTTSKLSTVFHCTGCDSCVLQPLGILKKHENSKNVKFALPTGPAVGPNCEHCNQRYHMGGPVWSGPLHSMEFVSRILETAPQTLGTWRRIQGVLSVVIEELNDVPLYYTLERLSATIHCETPPMLQVRSAILNAGYKVSYTHANKTSIKTSAPGKFVWDIMREWEKSHPIKRERLTKESPGLYILEKPITHEISFQIHAQANPESRRQGYVRFQANPTTHWGPGTRATAMVGDQKISKSVKNQGRKKRKLSDTSVEAKKDMEIST